MLFIGEVRTVPGSVSVFLGWGGGGGGGERRRVKGKGQLSPPSKGNNII